MTETAAHSKMSLHQGKEQEPVPAILIIAFSDFSAECCNG